MYICCQTQFQQSTLTSEDYVQKKDLCLAGMRNNAPDKNGNAHLFFVYGAHDTRYHPNKVKYGFFQTASPGHAGGEGDS